MATLVIAPQWIGDAVMSEPLLRALAERGESLAVAALPWVAPVYRAMPQVGEVIELPFAHGRLDWSARRQLAATLRGRFDTAYVLPNSIKSALIPFFAGIPQRVGYQGEGRPFLLNRRLPNTGGRPPMVAFYSALAGFPPPKGEHPKLHFDAGRLASVTGALGLVPGGYFAFAPGAEYGPAKCWPASHYAELARSLHARFGQPVILLGSGKETTLCEEIAQAAAQDRLFSCLQGALVNVELIRIDLSLNYRLAQAIRGRDEDHLIEAGFGVEREDHAAHGEIAAHHALHAYR